MASAIGVTSGLAMAVVLTAAACSTPPRTAATPDGGSKVMSPVAARILPMFQGLVVFDVNQPTYVAVFDVRPFIGVEMIYPGPNDEGRAAGGVQAVPVFYLTQANEERRAMLTPPVGGGEEYLYLVASRTPLHLGDFAVHPIALNEASKTWERGLPPYDQIDSLMRNVVKPLYDNDWDADVLILTPPGSTDPNIDAAALACGGSTARDAKVCAHSDHTVPTVLVASDALNRNLAIHYAPNGSTRSPASASAQPAAAVRRVGGSTDAGAAQWGGGAEHDGLQRTNTARAMTDSPTASGTSSSTATSSTDAPAWSGTTIVPSGMHGQAMVSSGKP